MTGKTKSKINNIASNKVAPIALTIAGSDSSGGAGIQADLKTFSALGVYGSSVITALTAQNTCGVTAVHEVPIDIITAQIRAVFEDLDVAAVKIGMLSSVEIIEAVSKELQKVTVPIVIDPVMVAKSGDRLLKTDALDALRACLLPMASILTPNLPEAADILSCKEAENTSQMQEQGKDLLKLGPQAVLMKGGHSKDTICRDFYLDKKGASLQFTAQRCKTHNTHGTGCTLSSALAAGLARGLAMQDAISKAHMYLQGAIKAADCLNIGSGHGPVHHFHELWA